MEWLVVFILVNIFQASRSTTHDQPFEKLRSSLLIKREVTESCDKDWYPFGDKCYKIGGKKAIGKVKWDKAVERCSQDGGKLVAVTSKEIQEFLVAFILLSVKQNIWLGLHDKDNETSYQWDDGSPFNYSKWEPFEPSGPKDEKEDCVEMVFEGKGEIGDWNDIDCNVDRPFICQTNKAKRVKKYDNPMLCSSEPQGGWKLGSSCFHLVSDRDTWYDAESYCQKRYRGHLATIKDISIETFLNYVFRDFKEELWIGIQIREQWQQKWASGWHVAYNNWEKDKNEFIYGTCVLRAKPNQWITVPCSRKYSFVCEVSTDSPPALKPTVENSFCPTEPHDWRDLDGDYCYYFENKNFAPWKDALFNCMTRGGSLASIHSQLENDVILPFVIHTKPAVFIGLYRQVLIDEEFAWTDGSPMDFLSWDSYEPNSQEEHCGEMRLNQKWNDINCNDKRGYICSIRKILPNKTTETPETTTCSDCVSLKTIIAVPLGAFLVTVLLGVVIYYFRREREQIAAKVSTAPLPKPFVDQPRYRVPSNCRQELVINEDAVYEVMQ